MKHHLLAILIALSAIVAIPASSSAATRPNVHIGGFRKVASVKACVSCALTAANQQHYTVFFKDTFTVLAGNNQVIVQVSCAPLKDGTTFVMVTGYSSDSATAEAARNQVREIIVKCVSFD